MSQKVRFTTTIECKESANHITTETNGKITEVKHFDSKAEIEAYSRAAGVPSSFFLPSVFASAILSSFRKVWSI
jgi:hypothetical protein